MAADDPVPVSDDELRHQDVMRSVVGRVQDTPYVLKGGTALLLARDLPRHSTDLDFDSGQKLNIDRRVREGVEAAGMEITRFSKVKDTDTVQRFKVHYRDPADVEGDDQFLKIETSFRDDPDPASVEVVNGIRTYKLDDIYDQKLEALGDRTKPRDLFDLAHLTKVHGDKLSDDQLLRAEAATSDVDELAHRYDESFGEDPILARFGDAEDTVLEFREAVENELRSRGLNFGSEVTPDDQNEAYAAIQKSLSSDLYSDRNAATMALFTQSDQRFDGVMQQLLPELENPRDVREVAAQLADNPHVVDAMETTIAGQPDAAQRYDDIRETANTIRHDDGAWDAIEPKLREANPAGAEAVGGAVSSLAGIIHEGKEQEAGHTSLNEPLLDKDAAFAWIKRSFGADRTPDERNAATLSILAHSPEWRVDSELQRLIPDIENPKDHREVTARLVADPQATVALEDSMRRLPELSQRLDDMREVTQIIGDSEAKWSEVEGDLNLISAPISKTVSGAVSSLTEVMQVEARQEQDAPKTTPNGGLAP